VHYALSDYLMDAVHNSIEAGAAEVVLRLEEPDPAGEISGEILLELTDDGCGMDAETLKRALDPFYTDGKKHAGRKVGLGLPFLKQLLDDTGGSFLLESEPGVGTKLVCRFNAAHIDTPPAGDLAGALSALFSYPGDFELRLYRSRGDVRYGVSRSELREALGDLESPASLALLNQYLESQEEFHGETDP
jgi:anti-sigma regulatory factor (Ser/Thr protein kinase)